MAELGEAPVPSSGGGHNPPNSGPRSSGPNNQQPPVRPKTDNSSWYAHMHYCSNVSFLYCR